MCSEVFFLLQSIAAFFTALANTHSWQIVLVRLIEDAIGGRRFAKASFLLELFFAAFFSLIFSILIFFRGGGILSSFDATADGLVFALLPICSVASTALGLIRLDSNFRQVALYKIIAPSLRLLGAMGCWVYSLDIYVMTVVWVLSEFFASLYINYLALKSFEFFVGVEFPDALLIKGFVIEILDAWFIGLVDLPVQYADRIIVGVFLSPHVYAAYILIRRIAGNIVMAVDPFFQILLPIYAKLLVSKNLMEVKVLTDKYSLRGGLLMLLVSMAALITGCILDDLLFKSILRENLSIYILMLSGAIFIGWYSPYHPLLYAAKKYSVIFKITLLVNFLFLILVACFSCFDVILGVVLVVIFQPILIGEMKRRFFLKNIYFS